MWKVLALLICLTSPALAQSAGGIEAAPLAAPCESCAADEQQVGDYVPPAVPSPRPSPQLDWRGNPISVPVAGVPTVYHRPGSGLWLYGQDQNNIYVDSKDNRTMLRLRREF